MQQSLLQEVDIDPAAPTLSATLLQEVAMAAPFGMSEEDEGACVEICRSTVPAPSRPRVWA